jgi:hypothetical protein
MTINGVSSLHIYTTVQRSMVAEMTSDISSATSQERRPTAGLIRYKRQQLSTEQKFSMPTTTMTVWMRMRMLMLVTSMILSTTLVKLHHRSADAPT